MAKEKIGVKIRLSLGNVSSGGLPLLSKTNLDTTFTLSITPFDTLVNETGVN